MWDEGRYHKITGDARKGWRVGGTGRVGGQWIVFPFSHLMYMYILYPRLQLTNNGDILVMRQSTTSASMIRADLGFEMAFLFLACIFGQERTMHNTVNIQQLS